MVPMRRLRNYFWDWWQGFRDWIDGKDACELCGNEKADYICVGCEKRICCMCNSGYYEDAELCRECRKDITPEEEEQDRRDAIENEEDDAPAKL
jgi:hypothetical protein